MSQMICVVCINFVLFNFVSLASIMKEVGSFQNELCNKFSRMISGGDFNIKSVMKDYYAYQFRDRNYR